MSNTHWDREFRWSFERTRRRLLDMMDMSLDILDGDPAYHSFTLDGQSILLDDYLEMRPERRPLVERLMRSGRLVAGPYYTLAEEFSISHEPLVRNLMWGRNTVEKYGGKCGTVAYTPSSWGQTGQLPQILADFGLDKMMFYRGISHHEADAEWIWEAPDGTRVLASRFALYARYNWYYQVHRAVTTGRVFEKDYVWGERDETPFRFADGLAGEDLSFELLAPALRYDPSRLRSAIEAMVATEGPHFTTEVFLAMHGHDISVAHPLESRIMADAREALRGKYSVEHADLEEYWKEVEKHLRRDALPVLAGERRSYLKQGKWTFLFPGTISARTYLKLQDFAATVRLVNYAEPLASLAAAPGAEYPRRYLDRGWQCLLSNHTHDANGGCAPDPVCLDMEYRYRQAIDIGDIVAQDAMTHIAKNLSPEGVPADAMQLVVFNPLPFPRDAVALVDLEVPASAGAQSVALASPADPAVPQQPLSVEKSGAFVNSPWDVPTILDSARMKFYARFGKLPALGYRVYRVTPSTADSQGRDLLVAGPDTIENEHLRARVNANGTVDIECKATGRRYANLNYLHDQGEAGNAWKHVAPAADRVHTSLDVRARIAVLESGPLVAAITAECEFAVPADYGDGRARSERLESLPVRMEYRLERDATELQVTAVVDNRARNHWLRAALPTGLATDTTWADSHFDVVARPIPLPDCTGWAEPAGGTHPLRTFVDVSDGKDGLALFTQGLYEYEALEDAPRTLLLTLIRACRINLAMSEEKQTELPDAGVQCPGIRRFSYAICAHPGNWADANLPARAACYYTPVCAAMTGRGQGTLAHEWGLFSADNPNVPVTCVKQAEDDSGLVVRLFNPRDTAQPVALTFAVPLAEARRCRMDETDVETVAVSGNRIEATLGPKKIATFRVRLQR